MNKSQTGFLAMVLGAVIIGIGIGRIRERKTDGAFVLNNKSNLRDGVLAAAGAALVYGGFRYATTVQQ